MRTIATSHAGEKRDATAHLFLGPHAPPLFGGVAIVPDLHAAPGTLEGLFKMANHSEMR